VFQELAAHCPALRSLTVVNSGLSEDYDMLTPLATRVPPPPLQRLDVLSCDDDDSDVTVAPLARAAGATLRVLLSNWFPGDVVDAAGAAELGAACPHLEEMCVAGVCVCVCVCVCVHVCMCECVCRVCEGCVATVCRCRAASHPSPCHQPCVWQHILPSPRSAPLPHPVPAPLAPTRRLPLGTQLRPWR
jgi:hypothetical protein